MHDVIQKAMGLRSYEIINRWEGNKIKTTLFTVQGKPVLVCVCCLTLPIFDSWAGAENWDLSTGGERRGNEGREHRGFLQKFWLRNSDWREKQLTSRLGNEVSLNLGHQDPPENAPLTLSIVRCSCLCALLALCIYLQDSIKLLHCNF